MTEELAEGSLFMGIGSLQTADYRTDYAGYSASGNQKVNDFYSGLSSATEKSVSKETGEVLGLTMISYSDSLSYGMNAFYSDQSTEQDPIIRVSSNYGGEQRYYDVHVNEVNPRSASQLEMFALSCYQDDKGNTDGGIYGSFTRMKAYVDNAAYNGYGVDLNNPDNVSAKLDWVAMLKQMANVYVQNSQTYTQYLDCNTLAFSLEKWSDRVEQSVNTSQSKDDLLAVLQNKISEMTERIENGDIESTFQIGGQSFTEKERNKLIEKIDKNIDAVKEEQKESIEKQQKESIEKQKAEDNEVTEAQIKQLLTDNNERRFDVYGPSAPEEVKQA